MKKILIIEDDKFVANIYRNKYLSVGYDARIALTGEEGMIQLKSFQPDLVQLDLLLPIVDGIEIIKHIRSRPEMKSVPVIVLSNAYMPKLVQDAWRAGADKCLAKADCTPNVMLEVIQKCLNPPPPPAPGGTVFLSAPAAVRAEAAPPEADTAFQEELRHTFQQEVPKTLQALRSMLQRFSKTADEAARHDLMADLHRKARSVANNSAIVGFARMAHLAAVLEALSRELANKVRHANDSSLRTLAQGIDQLDKLAQIGGVADQAYAPAAFKILVVDDEVISRRAVAHSLERASLTCVSVEDPQAALAMLNENRFDLIFLDVDMPVMSGFDLCKKLRTMAAHRQTPVVFVTGLTDFQSRANSALSGGNDLIAKPFLFTELALKALCFLLKARP